MENKINIINKDEIEIEAKTALAKAREAAKIDKALEVWKKIERENIAKITVEISLAIESFVLFLDEMEITIFADKSYAKDIKSAIDDSIIMVAIDERTIYLNAPSSAFLSLSNAINIKDATAATSRNTYKENRSLTMTMPHIPMDAIMSRFIKLNLSSSSVIA